MKLTIERAVLQRALNHVQSVVERRNTIPILANVRLEAKDGALGFMATDLDIAINVTVPADVAQEGCITAPAHTMHDIVRKLPDGAQVDLEFAGADNRLHLKAGRSSFALSCLSPDEFPQITDGDLPHQFAIPAIEVRRLIDKTRFAISTEETRYYLNGIYMHAVTDGDMPALRAVATDGHRLARVEATLPEGASNIPGVIVPRKAVGELRKLIDETEAEILVQLSDTKVRFSFDDAVLTSKLIDGTFPDYSRVIPEGNDRLAVLDNKAFASAVDRVAIISTDKSRAVKVMLEDNKAVASATSAEQGTGSDEIPVDYNGPRLEIGFNSRYMLDITSQIEGDEMQLKLADSQAPMVILDTGDDSVLYVVMPMRV